MMKNNNYQNIKFLDVTLRDGGYRNGFTFEENTAKRLVKDLTVSNMDYIEIGYRNGLSNKSILVGPSGKSDNDYIRLLKSYCPQAQIGVMVHPRNVSYVDLCDLKELGVSIIRVCLTAPTMEENVDTINACNSMGFVTTANIIKVSLLSVCEVMNRVGILDQSDADVIYIADSFGNLIPDEVAEYIHGMRSMTNKTLGFHAHNNLSFALSNAICAINNGAEFIDSSICGMGFGTGNLATEIIAGYLERIGHGERLDFARIAKLASYFSKHVAKSNNALSSVDVIWGLNNLSSHFRKPIVKIAKEAGISVYEIVKMVKAKENILPSEKDIRAMVYHSLSETQIY